MVVHSLAANSLDLTTSHKFPPQAGLSEEASHFLAGTAHFMAGAAVSKGTTRASLCLDKTSNVGKIDEISGGDKDIVLLGHTVE